MSGNGVGMGKLSESEKELMLDNAKANLEMEGYLVTDQDESVLRSYLDGHLTEEDVLSILKGESIV